MVLRRWGVLQDNLVLSTGLIMRIGHCKETGKLTFRALALVGANRGIVGCVWFVYRNMELCYWFVHSNVKDDRSNK